MKNKKKKNKRGILLRDGLLSSILSLLACYFISLLFFNISFFNPLSKALEDFSFLDVYYGERLNEEANIDPNIIIINIEDAKRLQIANLLKEILKENPKVIGFDIILEQLKNTKADTMLSYLLNHEKVVSGYVFTENETIYNHPFFKGEGSFGFVNFNFGYQDAVIRDFTGHYEQFKILHRAFSVVIARKYLSAQDWEKRNLDQKLNATRVINYQGGYERFLNFSISEFMVLEDKSVIKDKAVLVGYLGTPTGNSYDIEDRHFTPLNRTTAGKSIPDMNGITIHANILSMIIADSFMYRISNFWLAILTFIFSFLASIYFIWLDKRLKISYRTVRKAVLFVFAIVTVWLTLILFKYGVVLKSTPIIAVTIFSAGFVKYYKHLVRYINTKWKFRSYLK